MSGDPQNSRRLAVAAASAVDGSMLTAQRRPFGKPKIVHVLNLDAIGGVERIFEAFVAHSHVRHQLENHVLVANRPVHPYLEPAVRAGTESIGHIRYWRGVKVPKWPASLREEVIARYLRSVRPDCIVLWDRFGDLRIAEHAARLGCPLLYYDHGATWWVDGNSEASRLFLAHLHGSICCARAAQRVMNLQLGWAGPTTVCLNVLRPDMRPPTLQMKTLPRDRPLRIGLAGRLVDVKGQVLAVHALRRLREQGRTVEVHMAGTGPDEPRIWDLAQSLGLANKVVLHGLVRDMRKFYSDIDIFLCASLREPCCLVNIEAQGWGCPVISADIDGLRETIVAGKTSVLIPPTLPLSEYERLGGSVEKMPNRVYNPARDEMAEPMALDPADIAEQIARLQDAPDHFAAMSAAAYEHVRHVLDFDRFAEALVQAIQDLRTARRNCAEGSATTAVAPSH